MKPMMRIAILLFVAVAAVAALALKPAKPLPETAEAPANPETREGIPRLLDLGAGKCVPCRMMKPILDELMSEHAHQFDTVFIDVWLDPAQGRLYGVRVIPTQIFFDEQGEELWRHEGFMSKEDIFKAWQHLGYTFEMTAGGDA